MNRYSSKLHILFTFNKVLKHLVLLGQIKNMCVKGDPTQPNFSS